MKKDIVIIGAGGFAQEVLWTIKDINSAGPEEWNVIGFASELEKDWEQEYKGLPVFDLYAVIREKAVDCAVFGIGDPKVKYAIYQRIRGSDLVFPNIIHPSVRFTPESRIDHMGIVVQADSALLPASLIQNFAMLNYKVTLGHDVVIGAFATLSPGALIMGNSIVGAGAYIGVGAVTREKVHIGTGAIIGAQAAVVSDISPYSVATGVPAKIIKTIDEWYI